MTARRWKRLRKNNTNVTRQAIGLDHKGHRKRGRQKTTWCRDLTSDLQKIGKT